MRPKKYQIYLDVEQRKELEGIIKRGKHSAATIKRANILLDLDENRGNVGKQEEIAERFKTSTVTIYNISKQFAEEGLRATLYRKKRETPPIQPIATGDIEARIIALACSEPPKGRNRWTLRLLEEKVIELQITDAISDNTIGRLLKKHHLSLILRNAGVYHRNKMQPLSPTWKMCLTSINGSTMKIALLSAWMKNRINCWTKAGSPFL